jgi:toluene monooxygenase system protein D
LTDRVGPVVLGSELGRAVVAVIREQNRDVEVQDRGSYLRVLARGRCEVTRQAVERFLGRPFRLPCDLELIMPSFSGSFSVTEDQATWTFERRS